MSSSSSGSSGGRGDFRGLVAPDVVLGRGRAVRSARGRGVVQRARGRGAVVLGSGAALVRAPYAYQPPAPQPPVRRVEVLVQNSTSVKFKSVALTTKPTAHTTFRQFCEMVFQTVANEFRIHVTRVRDGGYVGYKPTGHSSYGKDTTIAGRLQEDDWNMPTKWTHKFFYVISISSNPILGPVSGYKRGASAMKSSDDKEPTLADIQQKLVELNGDKYSGAVLYKWAKLIKAGVGFYTEFPLTLKKFLPSSKSALASPASSSAVPSVGPSVSTDSSVMNQLMNLSNNLMSFQNGMSLRLSSIESRLFALESKVSSSIE